MKKASCTWIFGCPLQPNPMKMKLKINNLLLVGSLKFPPKGGDIFCSVMYMKLII